MNKFLLGTTALVAASAFAAPAMSAERIQLQLRGFTVGGISYTDAEFNAGYRYSYEGEVYDSDSFSGIGDNNEINFGSSSEIHFIGSTTLDNGLEVSFRAELELEDDEDAYDGHSNADTIDEVYVQFDGGFGRVQFGQQDGVMDQTAVTAPVIFDGHGHQDNVSRFNLDPFSPYWRNPIVTVGDYTGDDIKLIYFTPSMNGFQLGFSYTPNPCKNDTGYAGCVYDDFARNYWEAAATWEVAINNIGLLLSGGYGQGESGGSSENPSQWTLGANLTFGGFTLGGSYRDSNTTGDNNYDRNDWDVGVSYETGPWGFNLAYAEMDASDTDITCCDYRYNYSDTANSWLAGLTYMYGPGMQIGFGVQMLDIDDRYRRTEFDPYPTDPTGYAYTSWEGFEGTSVFLENSITF